MQKPILSHRCPGAGFVLGALLITGLFIPADAEAGTGPVVISVFPESHTPTADISTQINVLFDTPIDPLTVNESTVMVTGRWSGRPSGTFSLQDNDTRVVFEPAEPFSAGELVTVSISKGLQSAGGEPLVVGYAWNFWTAAGSGSLDQDLIDLIEVREPGEPHIQTYGAHAADLNNDGWTDITLPNELSDDIRVFLNDGAGGYGDFTIHPIPNGDIASTNEAIDLDGDMDFDYVVGNGGNNLMCVFIGDGSGGFESATNYQAGTSVRGVAVLDLDGDGDMDVVTANRSASNLSLFFNNGDGTMQPAVPLEANGSQETALAAADANNDGIMDLFVGAFGSNEMILLLGDGNGGLNFSAKVGAGGSPWMLAAGDIDLDGNVDVVSANSFSNNAAVFFGNGQGGFSGTDIYPVGNFTLAIDLGDIDGDGDLDFVTSNYSTADWTLYENDGTGGFGNVRTLDASNAGSCATLHDRDNDGDLDITGIDEIDDLIFIFENPGNQICADFTSGNFASKCNPIGTISLRFVLLNNTAWDGTTVTFVIDGVDTVSGTLIGQDPPGHSRVSVQAANGYAPGDHEVVMISPACGLSWTVNCLDPNPEMFYPGDAEILTGIPERTGLIGNYPNPFNPSTTISYGLTEAGAVTLRVYDMIGREVATLVDGYQEPGYHTVSWDGRDESGRRTASGVYLCRLRSGGSVQTIRMMLIQ